MWNKYIDYRNGKVFDDLSDIPAWRKRYCVRVYNCPPDVRDKVGLNDSCPCGSGEMFKSCTECVFHQLRNMRRSG